MPDRPMPAFRSQRLNIPNRRIDAEIRRLDQQARRSPQYFRPPEPVRVPPSIFWPFVVAVVFSAGCWYGAAMMLDSLAAAQ